MNFALSFEEWMSNDQVDLKNHIDEVTVKKNDGGTFGYFTKGDREGSLYVYEDGQSNLDVITLDPKDPDSLILSEYRLIQSVGDLEGVLSTLLKALFGQDSSDQIVTATASWISGI